MAGALVDARRGALGARAEALHRRALVNVARLDVQRLGVDVVQVLGVGRGRIQRLLDGLGDGAVRECEDLAGLRHGLAADQVDDHAGLAG